MPKSMANGWKPNDHVFVTVPSLGSKYILQAHPFTIFSAAPSESTTSSGNQLESSHAFFNLLIRAQSHAGFTHDLLTHALTHRTIQIRLDGPYGSSHALDILSSSKTAIVIAGGSGIAVAYPLLWALLHTPNSIVDAEAARSSPPSSRKRKVKLLWITRKQPQEQKSICLSHRINVDPCPTSPYTFQKHADFVPQPLDSPSHRTWGKSPWLKVDLCLQNALDAFCSSKEPFLPSLFRNKLTL